VQSSMLYGSESWPMKNEKKKKPQDENIMSASAMQGGHNEMSLQRTEIERLDGCVVLK